MPENEIPQDVLDQAREAGQGARDAMNIPATAEPLDQAEPDVPADMSGVPDPYDVAGQEKFRADQRNQAVADRDAEPEVQGPETQDPTQELVETPVGNLSQESHKAALEAAMALEDSGTRLEIMEATPSSASDASAPSQPDQDVSVEPTTPEPQGPDMDR